MDPMFLLLCGSTVVFCVLMGYAFMPAMEGSSIGKRLESLQSAQKQQVSTSLRDSEEMNKSMFTRVILPIVDKMSKYFGQLAPNTTLEKTAVAIQQAGLQGKVTATQITTLSYLLMFALPILSISFLGIPQEVLSQPALGLLVAAFLGRRLPIGFVQGKAKQRQHEIQKALPFTLDLISISVEAGMALDGAMQIVTEKTTGPLTDELNLTLREIRLGKGRNEALTDMANRVAIDDLKSFITAVTYIARLGGSLVDVIRIQAGAMRIKRRQRAEEKAMKTPVKIMIPLVLFIFPSMFIVILAPAGITMVEEMATVPK